jgi:hypothetical protein
MRENLAPARPSSWPFRGVKVSWNGEITNKALSMGLVAPARKLALSSQKMTTLRSRKRMDRHEEPKSLRFVSRDFECLA